MKFSFHKKIRVKTNIVPKKRKVIEQYSTSIELSMIKLSHHSKTSRQCKPIIHASIRSTKISRSIKRNNSVLRLENSVKLSNRITNFSNTPKLSKVVPSPVIAFEVS